MVAQKLVAHIAERTCAVARLAALTIFAAVLVILAMASDASRLGSGLRLRLFSVTGTAGQIGVGAGQREPGLLVVIERPEPPAVRIVAVAA